MTLNRSKLLTCVIVRAAGQQAYNLDWDSKMKGYFPRARLHTEKAALPGGFYHPTGLSNHPGKRRHGLLFGFQYVIICNSILSVSIYQYPGGEI